MTKFNLKEHIAKNKATFFGSLTEGQFSWFTQDTDQQIGSEPENTLPFVYMHDNKGNKWLEKDYEGYGVFGGKDYYELLDQMNGGDGDRERGIDLAFNKKAVEAGKVLFPALTVSPTLPSYHSFTEEPKNDPNQSWYTPEEEDYYDQNDDDDDYNRYGDEDEDEELEEGKVEEAYNSYTFKVAKNFAKYMSKKEGRDFEVTMNSVDEYSFDLDLDGEPYAGGSYLIQNGNIHNVAVPGNPIYATTDDMLDYVGEGYMGQFYAPEYLEKKYGKEMAKKIEAEIDEMDENSWDRFTGMESAEEVDEYVADIVSMLKEGYDEFKRVGKGKKKTVAKNKGEEEVYGAGVKKGEEIEKKKMKVSELKAKIKEMVLAEMNLDVTDETSGYDFLAELEEMMNEEEFSVKLLVPTVYYNPETGELAETPAAFGADSELEDMGITNYSDGDELSEWVFDNDIEKAKYFEKEYPGLFKVEGMMSEAKEEEIEDEVDVDIESPEAMDEPTGGINVTQNADADLTGVEKEVQDNLEAALEAAKKIGDEKLQKQIGNSLTFFTRQHVVKEDLNESMFPMLKKILK